MRWQQAPHLMWCIGFSSGKRGPVLITGVPQQKHIFRFLAERLDILSFKQDVRLKTKSQPALAGTLSSV
jgi:hypothetical protein